MADNSYCLPSAYMERYGASLTAPRPIYIHGDQGYAYYA